MTDLAQKYMIPAEIMAFVNDGFLVPIAEGEAQKTGVRRRTITTGAAARFQTALRKSAG